MIVTLKAEFVDNKGGHYYRGERVDLGEETACLLVSRGAADPYRPEPERPRTIEATLEPAALRGAAKRDYLRRQIEAKGGTPEGKTLAALGAELKALEG